MEPTITLRTEPEALARLKGLVQESVKDEADFAFWLPKAALLAALADGDAAPLAGWAGRVPAHSDLGPLLAARLREMRWDVEHGHGEFASDALLDLQEWSLVGALMAPPLPKGWSDPLAQLRDWSEEVDLDTESLACIWNWKETYAVRPDLLLPAVAMPLTSQEVEWAERILAVEGSAKRGVAPAWRPEGAIQEDKAIAGSIIPFLILKLHLRQPLRLAAADAPTEEPATQLKFRPETEPALHAVVHVPETLDADGAWSITLALFTENWMPACPRATVRFAIGDAFIEGACDDAGRAVLRVPQDHPMAQVVQGESGGRVALAVDGQTWVSLR